MKRGFGVIVVLLVVAIAVVYYLDFTGNKSSTADIPNVTASPTVSFLGKTLNVPDGWGVYTFGTRGGTLTLTRKAAQGLNPMLTLEDERKAPEIPSQFVAGWEKSLRVPGFHPRSLQEYHDSAVDAAGERCVAMRWDGNQRPLKIVCISGNGRWRLTLSGTNDDVTGFDTMARQVPGFIRGL